MAKATRTAQQNNEIFGRFILILTVALGLLKLTGLLNISWIVVFAPMVVCFGLFILTLVVAVIVKAVLVSKK